MNKKYFLLLLLLGFVFPSNEISKSESQDTSNQIEEEKEIPDEKIYDIINRDLELYQYDLSLGSSLPLGTNISNGFESGNSMSLLIKTPYKTSKILNRFKFNISSEIFLKNYKYKTSGNYNSNYNIFDFYIILNPEDTQDLTISYGIGLAHINQSTNNQLAPSLKATADYKLNFQKLYSILVSNHIVAENQDLKYFLNTLDFRFGVAPELLLSFPGRSGEMTLALDLYFRINLFNI